MKALADRFGYGAGVLSALTSLVNDGIIVTDGNLEHPGPTIVYANDAVMRDSGFSRDEVIGSSPRMFQGPHTDRAALSRIRAALQAGTSVREELINYRKDGTEYFVELDITPDRAADGSVSGFVAIQRNVTFSRSSDRRFRALVEHSSEYISINSPSGIVLYVSPSVTSLLGYEPEEIVGRYGGEFVHPDDLVDIADGLTAKAAMAGTFAPVQFRFRHANGSWRWLEAVTTNRLDDPAIGGMVVNARDITDRKLLEDQLHQAMKTEAIGRIAGTVAHEFNNLLAVINGYAELIVSDLDGESGIYDEVHAIAAAGQRAKALTTQLLTFSRHHRIQPHVVDINEVASETLRMLSPLLPERVEVRLDLEASPCWVSIDPDHLGQVIMNLSLNARDAIPDRGTLTITSRVVPVVSADGADIKRVVLEVADDGVGVAVEDQDRLFDPFFSTKDRDFGTGLGLAFVASVIERAGGIVSLRSEPGAGATFVIDLPYAAQGPFMAVEIDTNDASRSGRRVLVVDDDVFVAELAVQMLNRLGWNAQAAAGLPSSLETSDCDVVLCDIHMPSINGPELVARLQRTCPNVKVVYMTAYAPNDSDVERGDNAPTLRKPFSLSQLQAAMQMILD